ncbi:alpha/beta fold hydrolase [Psychrobium sp. nBUS_13]|uniref:alpha/beta fold hydrolase n=1 Tax=Psychrobium sp. nBUS_13 TaxID=3395319 RepID=UPI003EBAF982
MSINFKRIGQGQPVILIHGLFGNLDNLGRLARHLSENFEVISVDLPNHGLSSHIEKFDYPKLAAKIVKRLTSLGLNQCHFVGHSMGGKVAMQLALDFPQWVKSLVVADIAPVTYSHRHTHIFDALNAIDLTSLANRSEATAIVTDHGIDAGTAQFLLKNLAQENNAFVWRCNIANLATNYESIIGGLTGSHTFDGATLFIKGENSDYILSEHRPQIMQHFPKAQAKIIQGTGHWLHAEKPASFNKIVGDFIAKNLD